MFTATIGGNELRRGTRTGITSAGRHVEASSNIGRTTPAGSSRVERLDPFALPLRFDASATSPPTNACVWSSCTASAWCCAAPCAASRWRSTCRSPPISAWRSAWSRHRRDDGRRRSRARASRSGVVASALPPPTAATSSPNGRRWARVLGVPLLIAKPTGACASRSRGWRCASPRRSDAAAARHARQGGRRPRCGMPGRRSATAVHRGEREIIARN